jgi:hypothetical protein
MALLAVEFPGVRELRSQARVAHAIGGISRTDQPLIFDLVTFEPRDDVPRATLECDVPVGADIAGADRRGQVWLLARGGLLRSIQVLHPAGRPPARVFAPTDPGPPFRNGVVEM